MNPKHRFALVLTLCLFAAFSVQAAQAEEAAGLCAPSEFADLGIPDPMFASCACLPGGSFNCSGTGSTCSAATSSFLADCDAEADVACGLDAPCFVTIIEQNACVWTGSQYEVTGRARTRCQICS